MQYQQSDGGGENAQPRKGEGGRLRGRGKRARGPLSQGPRDGKERSMQRYVAQEYEALFTDSQGDHGRVREDVGAYRVRTVRAGETVEVEAVELL